MAKNKNKWSWFGIDENLNEEEKKEKAKKVKEYIERGDYYDSKEFKTKTKKWW